VEVVDAAIGVVQARAAHDSCPDLIKHRHLFAVSQEDDIEVKMPLDLVDVSDACHGIKQTRPRIESLLVAELHETPVTQADHEGRLSRIASVVW
jgi:hypothetical protein